jgi:hypothetical protein
MATSSKEVRPLALLKKRKYMKIAICLWQHGAQEAHQEYPDISVVQFENANKYYDSLRCEGCHCGSCVNLPELANNLDQSPAPLEPIAKLAQRLGEAEYQSQLT